MHDTSERAQHGHAKSAFQVLIHDAGLFRESLTPQQQMGQPHIGQLMRRSIAFREGTHINRDVFARTCELLCGKNRRVPWVGLLNLGKNWLKNWDGMKHLFATPGKVSTVW